MRVPLGVHQVAAPPAGEAVVAPTTAHWVAVRQPSAAATGTAVLTLVGAGAVVPVVPVVAAVVVVELVVLTDEAPWASMTQVAVVQNSPVIEVALVGVAVQTRPPSTVFSRTPSLPLRPTQQVEAVGQLSAVSWSLALTGMWCAMAGEASDTSW